MKKRGTLLIISILCALATTYLIYELLQQRVAEANPSEATSPIVVAAIQIGPYQEITADMVKVISIEANRVRPDQLTKLDDVIGQVSLQTFLPNEPIMQPLIAKPEGSNLFAMQIPEGLRAMSIPYSSVKGAGGHMAPGDRVDVMVTFTKDVLGDQQQQDVVKLTLQDIQVLAVGQERETPIEEQSAVSEEGEKNSKSSKSNTDTKSSTITLAVTPQQTESLGFAESFGEVRLLLRAPQDNKQVLTNGVRNQNALRP